MSVKVRQHIDSRRDATREIVPWLAHYGETARPLRSNYMHDYWLANRDAETIRVYVGILKEWAGISDE